MFRWCFVWRSQGEISDSALFYGLVGIAVAKPRFKLQGPSRFRVDFRTHCPVFLAGPSIFFLFLRFCGAPSCARPGVSSNVPTSDFPPKEDLSSKDTGGQG